MNNPNLFFNPFLGFQNNEPREDNYEKLINKINRLEKDIRILANRVNRLENIDNKEQNIEEESDMYMI